MTTDEEVEPLRQEKQALQTTKQTLREGFLEAIHARKSFQKQVNDLQGGI